MESPHAHPIDHVLRSCDTSPLGLDAEECARRLGRDGRNELSVSGSKTALATFVDQFRAVMVLILIAASGLSFALGKVLEGGAIVAIVILFGVLGFVQEFRAERAIAALRDMAAPVVRVTRTGRLGEVPAGELVVGDIVHVEAGSIVPADLRLIEVAGLRAQEAALTGESEPVDKIVDVVDADAALGDRRNLAYTGTQITYGRGIGVVVATGMTTELGKIASLLAQAAASLTPLQERLDRVGKQLAAGGLVVALVVMALGAMAGEDFGDLVLTAISVAVAVIPEGLPAVVTFTLAIGAQRMLHREALIRKLPAVETLGSVTVICSDKTGTLTQNVMTVTAIETFSGRSTLDDEMRIDPSAVAVVAAGSLCNDADLQFVDGDTVAIGDPTETAFLVAAQRVGIDVADLRSRVPRCAERPFDSERKRMSTAHPSLGADAPTALAALPRDRAVVFVKGAVDGMLAHATGVWTGSNVVPLDDPARSRVLEANDEFARSGRRVLGVAFRTIGAISDDVDYESELVLLGLVAIVDPPRPEVRDSVATCISAGIRTVMITGDHPATALAIARDLGIARRDRVVTGVELEGLNDGELKSTVEDVDVFARVAPEHKLRIVEALRRAGHVVAMTGDGVNDAPALKTADIGVAMGITGTDVSKEAADVVLRDDNFATIVAAVEEGRVIYDNLRRFVRFAVAGNIGKMVVMVGWPIPFLVTGDTVDAAVALLPLQLLWLNLMTDGLLGLSMGVEPAERGVMRRAPNRPGMSIWADGLGVQAVWSGVLIGAIALALGIGYHEADRPEWQSMIFMSLAVLQIFQALATRSSTASLRQRGWRTNPVMLGIIAIVAILQLLAVYSPLRGFLDLEPLRAVDLAVCVAAGVGLFALLEIHKSRLRRR